MDDVICKDTGKKHTLWIIDSLMMMGEDRQDGVKVEEEWMKFELRRNAKMHAVHALKIDGKIACIKNIHPKC